MSKRLSAGLIAGVLAIGIVAVSLNGRSRQEQATAIPAPAVDQPAGSPPPQIAVLAGGCFWGVQAVYQHMNGVMNAISGYAGGEQRTAQYELVGSGRTGHAEAVEITFDPRVVTYGQLLHVFFSVAHDPTQLNRQGPDVGTQYRSTIFPNSAEQARVAKAYIDQLNRARVFAKPIATTLEPDRMFYPAEDYHQDFLTRNPSHPYIVLNDMPKIDDLQRMFPAMFRARPVLVMSEK
jgi:peptide-methionine (S)-S-oxide reductase